MIMTKYVQMDFFQMKKCLSQLVCSTSESFSELEVPDTDRSNN